jgi:hypothetical protein
VIVPLAEPYVSKNLIAKDEEELEECGDDGSQMKPVLQIPLL